MPVKRPPARSSFLRLRLKPDELHALEVLATARGVTVSDLCREVLEDAMRKGVGIARRQAREQAGT